jgi:hypothetical protein
METLVKLFGEFTFTIDCKGTICTAWTANEAFLHGKVPVLVGQKLEDIICGDQYTPIREMLQRVWQTGRAERIEYPAQFPSETRWFVTRLIPLAQRESVPCMLCFIAWDLTDRKFAEEHRKSKALLAESEKLAGAGSWGVDLKAGSTIWSDNLHRLHGFSPGEVIPAEEFCLPMIHPDERERAKSFLAQAISSTSPSNTNFVVWPRMDTLPRIPTPGLPRFFPNPESPSVLWEAAWTSPTASLPKTRFRKAKSCWLRQNQLPIWEAWKGTWKLMKSLDPSSVAGRGTTVRAALPNCASGIAAGVGPVAGRKCSRKHERRTRSRARSRRIDLPAVPFAEDWFLGGGLKESVRQPGCSSARGPSRAATA